MIDTSAEAHRWKGSVRVLQRNKCPAAWYIGRRFVWVGEIIELVEIDGDQYTWIGIRPARPGETTALINKANMEKCA